MLRDYAGGGRGRTFTDDSADKFNDGLEQDMLEQPRARYFDEEEAS
jgi:hypothetical protein